MQNSGKISKIRRQISEKSRIFYQNSILRQIDCFIAAKVYKKKPGLYIHCTGQVGERPNSGYIIPIMDTLRSSLIFHELKSKILIKQLVVY